MSDIAREDRKRKATNALNVVSKVLKSRGNHPGVAKVHYVESLGLGKRRRGNAYDPEPGIEALRMHRFDKQIGEDIRRNRPLTVLDSLATKYVPENKGKFNVKKRPTWEDLMRHVRRSKNVHRLGKGAFLNFHNVYNANRKRYHDHLLQLAPKIAHEEDLDEMLIGFAVDLNFHKVRFLLDQGVRRKIDEALVEVCKTRPRTVRDNPWNPVAVASMMKLLLSRGANPNAKVSETIYDWQLRPRQVQMTPLYALWIGSMTVAPPMAGRLTKILLDAGADMSLKENYDALIRAFISDATPVSVVQKILTSPGIGPRITEEHEGMTLFEKAASEWSFVSKGENVPNETRVQKLRALLNKQRTWGSMVAERAIKTKFFDDIIIKSPSLLKLLFEHGLILKEARPEFSYQMIRNWATELLQKAYSRDYWFEDDDIVRERDIVHRKIPIESVRILLKAGADPNRPMRRGLYVFSSIGSTVANFGETATLRLLMRYGLDVCPPLQDNDEFKNFPIYRAIVSDHPGTEETLKFLLALKAYPKNIQKRDRLFREAHEYICKEYGYLYSEKQQILRAYGFIRSD